MVLERGNEYKMVSIMRQQRRQMVSNPYETNENNLTMIPESNTLSQIEEEQTNRWANAVPRFGKEEDEVSVPDEETKEEPE
jgi:hypothetical protein